LQIPLDTRIKELPDLPYTISFVIRKRQQIDNFNELPQEKRPTEALIWDSPPEDVEEWFDTVFDLKKKQSDLTISVRPDEIEK
jgi:hypothetical protein